MSLYEGRLPSNYEEAARMLRGGSKRTGVPNTVLRKVEVPKEKIEVVYLDSVIATLYADGSARFTDAGHPTASTHRRLNAMVPRGTRFSRFEGTGVIRMGREVVASSSYDLMRHIDGRLEAVRREA